MVTVIRDPVCLDKANQVARDKWPKLISERRNFCKEILPQDCRSLLFFIEDAERSEWVGYRSREQYIRKGLQLDPSDVDWALDGLKRINPDKAVGFDEAKILGQRRAGPGRGHKTPCSARSIKYGTREHWLARFDRDGKTILAAKVRSGEISAYSAAQKAGYRKKPKKRCPACGHEWR